MDHILAAGIERNNITQAGHLPFGLGFHTDHRGVFADMNGDSLMRIVMEEPKKRESRRLSSKNSKHRLAYLGELKKNLEAHNIFDRVGK